MFGIGGWKQVGATFDMKRQAAIREQLEQAGIEYQVKVQNRLKSGVLSGNQRARRGKWREKMRHREREYLFYVQKAEEEKARRVIESAGR